MSLTYRMALDWASRHATPVQLLARELATAGALTKQNVQMQGTTQRHASGRELLRLGLECLWFEVQVGAQVLCIRSHCWTQA